MFRLLASTSIQRLAPTYASRRMLQTSPPALGLTEGEQEIYNILKEKLTPAKLNVKDISGGCGAMYAVEVSSAAFKGQTLVKQHRMVVAAIEKEIKAAHGIQVKTEVPDN